MFDLVKKQKSQLEDELSTVLEQLDQHKLKQNELENEVIALLFSILK